MSNYPIVLFVFNRPHHTQETIEALAENTLASDSELFVFCDGPRSESDFFAVEETRNICRQAKGFKKVTLFEHQINKGLKFSLIFGITHVLAQHEAIIVIEDDIKTHSCFLDYMNNALRVYKNSPEVGMISGFNYIYEKATTDFLPDTYFIQQPGCWGWGTWSDRWDLFDNNIEKLIKEIEKRELMHAFDADGNYPFFDMLKATEKGLTNSWGVMWYAALFLNGKLSLWPKWSLVKNIGFDGTGVHCNDAPCLKTMPVKLPVPNYQPSVVWQKPVINPLGQQAYFLASRHMAAGEGKELFSDESGVAYPNLSRHNDESLVKNTLKNFFFEILRNFITRKGNNFKKKSWEDIEYFDENWKMRIAMMADFIEEEKSIIDLGCGMQWLKEIISSDSLYYPVDYQPRSNDTIICDFNKKEFPIIQADLAFISGCMEYVHDYDWFIQKVSHHCYSAIISYCTLEKFPDISVRRSLTWVNDLRKQELIELFEENGMLLARDAHFSDYEILKFCKK